MHEIKNIEDYNYIINNLDSSASIIKEVTLKKRNVELYNKVISYCQSSEHIKDLNFKTRLYHYLIEYKEIPKCECGYNLVFRSIIAGYAKYCSSKCANASKTKIEAFKKSCLDKYGVDNPNKVKEIREKVSNTFKEKHGVGSAGHEQLLDKLKKTSIEKYGKAHFTQSETYKENYKKACINKYGVNNPAKDESVKKKIGDTVRKTKLKNLISNINVDDIEILDSGLLKLKCNECNNFYEINRQLLRIRHHSKHTKCTACNPIGTGWTSETEKEIAEFVKTLSNSVIENNKTILNGKELDIYLPDDKIAIEYNGIWYHNELYKENNYHINKTLICQNAGIHLIHIWEDYWMHKKEIVKSRIKNLLGKTERKIYARKCQLKEVNVNEARLFLDNNHIQGYIQSKFKIGLYFEDELVSLMTFGNSRKAIGGMGDIELLRFCNSLNTSVIGSGAKLFSYYIKNLHDKTKKIVSFADRDWTMFYENSIYFKLGFDFIGYTDIGYWYIIDGMRKFRYAYRKSELVKQGFDKNMSEHEIMFNRGYYRIYDTGNLKFEFNKFDDI